jgi:hypothetical protein
MNCQLFRCSLSYAIGCHVPVRGAKEDQWNISYRSKNDLDLVCCTLWYLNWAAGWCLYVYAVSSDSMIDSNSRKWSVGKTDSWKADPRAIYDMVHLVHQLGFKSADIDALLDISLDHQIARSAIPTGPKAGSISIWWTAARSSGIATNRNITSRFHRPIAWHCLLPCVERKEWSNTTKTLLGWDVHRPPNSPCIRVVFGVDSEYGVVTHRN